MKELFKNAGSLFLKRVIVAIMCFFVVISISVLCTAAFTKNIGYTAYGTKEGSDKSVELYTYYSKDGEDTQKKEYEEQGYTVTTSNIRSSLEGTGNRVFLSVSQIFCILILTAFVYPQLWQLGTKDSNLVKFKHKNEDIFKGLKIGALSTVPALVFFLFCIIFSYTSFDIPVSLYRFVNCQFLPLLTVISGKSSFFTELSVIKLVCIFLLLLFVPAVSFGAYLLGYRDISLLERFIYKKNKEKSR